ncbi:hypothetical protein [Streptomyces specialis]|uniref:hypothetical protein n=1 Tax=Streptomyces specialis TaxID=498367 RepID=UPI00073F1CFF|nr:hypothetical protein [Streptomyces specialis]
MDAIELLPVISLLSLVTVEFGGHALLRFLTVDRDALKGPTARAFFRAGHAHAGVLLTLSLVYFLYLPRADLSSGAEWLSGIVLLAGVLAQSGGFFLHLAVGREEGASAGTTVTRAGAVLIAIALVILAVGLIRAM